LALVSLEGPQDLLLGSIEFQVGGLTELATVCPFSSVQWGAGNEASFSAQQNAATRQCWTAVDSDELELDFMVAFGGRGFLEGVLCG